MKNEKEILEGIERYLEKRLEECVAHDANVTVKKIELEEENLDTLYFKIRIQVYNEILEIIKKEKKEV